MNSRTFANPSVGMLAGRAASNLATATADVARSIWNFLGELGENRARGELTRMADHYQNSRPEFAAQLREAARRSWYGQA